MPSEDLDGDAADISLSVFAGILPERRIAEQLAEVVEADASARSAATWS